MGEVHCRDPRSGIIYVYSSESYWDKETKTKKARRKLIGKLDENGNVVPTKGTPGRNKKTAVDKKTANVSDSDAVIKELTDSYEQRLRAQLDRITSLENTIRELTKDKENLLDSIDRVLAKYRTV
jgi:hypothetical protein